MADDGPRARRKLSATDTPGRARGTRDGVSCLSYPANVASIPVEVTEGDAPILREKQATEIWTNMLNSFRTGATMDPLVVVNGRHDSMFMPAHLANLGFHLLRARTQVKELADTLRK